jgi:hypothetical protein
MNRAIALALASILPVVVAANAALAQDYGPEPAGEVAGGGGVAGAGGGTAFTGGDVATALIVAVALVAVGGLAILFARRSERQASRA